MKNIHSLVYALLVIYWIGIAPSSAQTNETLHYQGVARNAQGAPLAGATIAVRLSIKDAISNGNTLYSESKSVSTNAFGLYSISINDGSGVRTGDFNAINWSAGTRFLQTEIDPANGTAFMNMGTQQMQSVPHALSAKSLDGVANPEEGDLLEFKNGNWSSKPKVKRYHVSGLGTNPSPNLNFLGSKAVVTIEKENPAVTVIISKVLGSNLPSGGVDLYLNLGYRKIGGVITEFESNRQKVVVHAGNSIPMTIAGTYQTDFKTGETYEIGIVGLANNYAGTWSLNENSKGYVEISY